MNDERSFDDQDLPHQANLENKRAKDGEDPQAQYSTTDQKLQVSEFEEQSKEIQIASKEKVQAPEGSQKDGTSDRQEAKESTSNEPITELNKFTFSEERLSAL